LELVEECVQESLVRIFIQYILDGFQHFYLNLESNSRGSSKMHDYIHRGTCVSSLSY